MRFKEFLLERVRDVAQADRLGNYLVKRQAGQTESGSKRTGKAIRKRPEWVKPDEKVINLHKKPPTMRQFDKIYDPFVSDLRKNDHLIKASANPKLATHHTDFPMHKLNILQTIVHHDTDYFKKEKLNDDKPILVYKHKDGKHYIFDGYHRWFRNKLLGKKTIAATELHFGRTDDKDN